MDKVLRPHHLETDPNTGEASKEWLYWKQTFDNFLAVLPQEDLNKLSVLVNFISPAIFHHIEECTEYEAAVGTLQALFMKPRNKIFARHILATRRQQPHETLDEYLQGLKSLSKDCNFQSVTADKCVFSTGGASPSFDILSKRVPFGLIRNVYDPCVNSPFHMIRSP